MLNNALNYKTDEGLSGLKKVKLTSATQLDDHANELSALTLRGKINYDGDPPSDSNSGCPIGYECVEGVCVPIRPIGDELGRRN